MNALIAIQTVETAPRRLDPAAAFDALTGWMRKTIVAREVPGIVLGISGTDSILAFLVCARAFAQLGRPERVMGIHFGHAFPPEGKTPAEVEKLVTLNPRYRWVARAVMPWLRDQVPGALLATDSSIDHLDDYQRWAAVFRASLNGASRTEPLAPGENFWVAGTRNATEEALGSYSNISGAVSLQPILPLWKSEVLQLCNWLGAPRIALEQSRQVDCDCGRFDLAADHIEQVDWILMARAGRVSRAWLARHVEASLLDRLEAFVKEQGRYAGFKKEIPYRPPAHVFA